MELALLLGEPLGGHEPGRPDGREQEISAAGLFAGRGQLLD